MKYRQLKQLVLVMVFAIAGALPANAAGLIINISEEYGGYYRPNDWYPVIVSIQNQSGKAGDRTADFRGTISVESDSHSDKEGAYEFIRDVEVPSGSILRFTIYVKFRESPATQPIMEVRADNGRLIQSIPLNVQALDQSQILQVTLSDEARNYYFPRHPGAIANRPLQRAFISPRNLPIHWAGYDPVDMLVFPGWPDARFGEDNLKALEDWVAMGGTLAFLGGSQSVTYQNDLAERLLPVRVNGSRRGVMNPSLKRIDYAPENAQIDPDKSLLVSDVSVDPDAEVVFDASGGIGEPMPMLVRKQHGRGQILFLGVDLESPSSPLNTILAPHWMAVIPINNVVDWRYQYAEQMGKTTLVTGRAARPPNVIVIILICVLYTAVVGPVNFFILSRMGRIQLAWLTVPAIVFIFSGLIYTFGTLTKGGKTIGREITLLMGYEDEAAFEERSAVSVFVPSPGKFFVNPIEPNQTVADNDRWHLQSNALADLRYALPGAGPSSGFVFARGNPVMESTDERIAVRNWPLRTFDTAQFEIRGPRLMPGAIEADLTYNSSNGIWLEGSITNSTGLDFYDAAIVAGGRALPLRDFAANDERTFSRANALYEHEGASGRRFIDRDSAFRNPTQTAGQDEQSDSFINHDNALHLVRSIFEPPYSGRVLPPVNGGFYFVGLAESDDLTIQTNLDRSDGTRAIVVLVRLNPVPAPGPLVVPQELVQVNLQEFSENAGSFEIESDNARGIRMRFDTTAIFSTELPFRTPGATFGGGTFDRQFANFDGFDSRNHDFKVGALALSGNNPIILPPSDERTTKNAVSTDNVTTPYSGRTWVAISYSEKKAPQGAGAGLLSAATAGYHEAEIPKVEFSLTTSVDESGQ